MRTCFFSKERIFFFFLGTQEEFLADVTQDVDFLNPKQAHFFAGQDIFQAFDSCGVIVLS